jgi:hypothetical protein
VFACDSTKSALIYLRVSRLEDKVPTGAALIAVALAMVFTADERLDPPVAGAFSTLDLWYMDQFARTIAVMALTSNDRAAAKALAERLGTSPYYFMANYPLGEAVLRGYGPLQQRLNAAADPSSDEYKQLVALQAAPPAGAN